MAGTHANLGMQYHTDSFEIFHIMTHRLNTLDLPSLLYRRRFLDMVKVYKIIHGLDGAIAIIIYLRGLMDSSYIN